MKTFIQFLLHAFAAFFITVFFSIIVVYFQLEMPVSENNPDISPEVYRQYRYLLAQVVAQHLGVVVASIISLFVLSKNRNRYWIGGLVFALMNIGAHFQMQALYLKIQLSKLFVTASSDAATKAFLIDAPFLISLAVISYLVSLYIMRKALSPNVS